MNLEEFETYYRSTIEGSLNQLQTTVLLTARLQASINSVGQDLQELSRVVEQFINEQKTQ